MVAQSTSGLRDVRQPRFQLISFFDFSTMRSPVLLLVTAATCFAVAIRGSQSAPPRYSNVWAVGVEGGKESADALAKEYEFVNKGQVSRLQNIFPITD